MTTDVPLGLDERVADMTTELAAEFSSALSRSLVATVVLDARRDLDGRVVPEAVAYLLHRLARHRLNVMRAGGPA